MEWKLDTLASQNCAEDSSFASSLVWHSHWLWSCYKPISWLGVRSLTFLDTNIWRITDMVGSQIFRHIEQFQVENITKHLEYKTGSHAWNKKEEMMNINSVGIYLLVQGVLCTMKVFLQIAKNYVSLQNTQFCFDLKIFGGHIGQAFRYPPIKYLSTWTILKKFA